MHIRSLLLGSVAALAAISSTQAADAIIAAEPEPMDYVRVCDAFGTGYFYIPGTETCLKVGGYVRFEVEWNNGGEAFIDDDWDAYTRGRLEIISKSDTELGELTGFLAIHGESYNQDTGEDDFYFDEVYLQLGGFKAGNYLNWWDANDLPGELDDLGSNRFNSIAYIYTGSAVTAGIQLDEIESDDSNELGLEAVIQASVGPAALEVLGSYDFDAEEGAVRAIGSFDVGPGTFYIAGIYSSGENIYFDVSEWTVAAAYAWQITEKFEVIPEFQYYWDVFDADDFWTAGATMNYTFVENFAAKVSVKYDDDTEDWGGIVRLQRDF
jgi:hypothetical protein